MSDDSDTAVVDTDEDLPIDPDVIPSDRTENDAVGPDDAGNAADAPTTPAAPRRQIRPRGRARVRYLAGRVRRVIRNRGDILAVIATGGALDSLGRWGLGQAWPHSAGAFPWATFVANMTGCLLLGVLMVFVIEVLPPSRYLRPFLGVGVLGGFTTFSTYMLDARDLLVSGHSATAGEYVFGSLLCGLLAVWAGVGAARLLVRLVQRRSGARHDRRVAPRPSGRRVGGGSAPSIPTASPRPVTTAAMRPTKSMNRSAR
jgi:fluoride exporter